jgi:hypothetical protein
MFKSLERKIEMTIAEKLLVGFIERSLKNYVTTIIGILGVALFAFNYFGVLIPAQYHDFTNIAAVLAQGIALTLAKDSGQSTTNIPVPNKLVCILLILGMSMVFPSLVRAQTTTTSNYGFVMDSGAIAFHYDGAWSAATHIKEAYDFYDFGKTKSNHIYLTGHELVASTPGFSIYAGGITIEPDLTTLFKKFNVPSGTFAAQFNAALGNGIPTSGGSHVSALAGGLIKYRATSSLSWNPLEIQWVRYGPHNGAAISTGISYLFGSK